MRLEDLFPQLLLALVNICVKLVAVLADRELLIVVNGNVDLLAADWLVLGIMELRDVGVAQGLLSSQTLVRIEMK
jgi:hypothetical protein